MQTVQLPFFLNSGQGRNRSSTGHAFDVELSPPIVVPKNARNTRLFVQEASAVYSFPNVTSTTNRVYLFYRSNLFTLEITPGLYATIDEMQAGIADAAIAAGVNKTDDLLQAVTTRADFGSQYLQVTANNVTSRVQLEIMDQDVQIALDPFSRGDDLFVNVLGFAKNQAPLHAASAQYYALVNRENLPGDTAPPGYATLVLEWRLDGQADFLAPYALNSDGNPQFLKFYIPASNHRYSAKGLMDAMNSSMRGEHALQALTYTNVPWANALPVVNFLEASNHDGGDAEVGIMIQSALTDVAAWRFPATYGAGAQTISAPLQNVTAPVSSLLPTNMSRFLETRVTTSAWVENTNAARQVVTGLNPATVDRVHSLQIACPGLAAGVHVNGRGGSSTLCRFPVNTEPGGVIQYEPINPIKNTYDMSGTRITRFRVELQDQHGDPVDTRSEEYNCTIVIEYEIPSLATTGDH